MQKGSRTFPQRALDVSPTKLPFDLDRLHRFARHSKTNAIKLHKRGTENTANKHANDDDDASKTAFITTNTKKNPYNRAHRFHPHGQAQGPSPYQLAHIPTLLIFDRILCTNLKSGMRRSIPKCG